MKDFAKATLCGVYKYSGAMIAQEAMARVIGHPFLVVLHFHRVTDAIPEDGLTVSTRRFRKICHLLRRSFHVVPLAEIFRMLHSKGPIPRRTIAITFDDSYRDNLFAARLLAEYHLPACFFVPTGFVDTDAVYEWDKSLARMPHLRWDDLREMVSLGHEIGSHSVTHPNMATISVEEARRELVESRKTLEDQLGCRVRWFAYPFGGNHNFRNDRLPLVYEAGYEGCVSGHGGFVYPHLNQSIVPREAVPYFRSILNLELHLSGCLHWLYTAKRRVGLL
jgi:peptidoglycan/xylan/chitin deacetylase (PgdA/CDA1 family)